MRSQTDKLLQQDPWPITTGKLLGTCQMTMCLKWLLMHQVIKLFEDPFRKRGARTLRAARKALSVCTTVSCMADIWLTIKYC